MNKLLNLLLALTIFQTSHAKAFESVVRINNQTASVRSFDELGDFENNTLIVRPTEDSEAVAVHSLKTIILDTTYGNIINFGHGVGDYIYIKAIGGGSVAQSYAREARYTVKNETQVDKLYGNIHIVEQDFETSGNINNLILDSFPDSSATSTWFDNVGLDYLDPRFLIRNRGGYLGSASGLGLTSYTAKLQDSGAVRTFVAGAPVTVTIPANMEEGFRSHWVQGDANQITFSVSSPGVLLNKNGHTKTGGLHSRVTVEYLSPGTFLLSGETGT